MKKTVKQLLKKGIALMMAAATVVSVFVSCAVEILLENKHNAKKKIELLSDEDKNQFIKFPIYNLL